MLKRSIARLVTVPSLTPGFLGAGHRAAPVVAPGRFRDTDPFILMMDDHLDMGEQTLEHAHPHAGFETVTFILEGALYDRDEGGHLGAGDVQWMTAGRGIVHGEAMRVKERVRLLQLWLTLPKADRWAPPRSTVIRGAEVPAYREAGASVRVYSGTSGPVSSATPNYVPVLLLSISLDPDAAFTQAVPQPFNGFALTITGDVTVEGTRVSAGQVGWFDRPTGSGASSLTLSAGSAGATVLIYAGQAQGDDIVSHGPFIADTQDDIARLFREYRNGDFVRLSDLTSGAQL
jgi:redox-sensitive bicupin YhaK (pirin superfamily)